MIDVRCVCSDKTQYIMRTLTKRATWHTERPRLLHSPHRVHKSCSHAPPFV